MANKDDDIIKMGFTVWMSIAILIIIWFLSGYIRGRRNLQYQLHVIEDGLRRMQNEIEFKRRQKSIGYVDNIDEILNQITPENLSEFMKVGNF